MRASVRRWSDRAMASIAGVAGLLVCFVVLDQAQRVPDPVDGPQVDGARMSLGKARVVVRCDPDGAVELTAISGSPRVPCLGRAFAAPLPELCIADPRQVGARLRQRGFPLESGPGLPRVCADIFLARRGLTMVLRWRRTSATTVELSCNAVSLIEGAPDSNDSLARGDPACCRVFVTVTRCPGFLVLGRALASLALAAARFARAGGLATRSWATRRIGAQ